MDAMTLTSPDLVVTVREGHSPADPIEVLRSEHRLIERALTAFVAWADTVRSLGAAERAELERFTRFFDRFVDRYHHAKEEDILFRALDRADPRARAIVHASFLEQEEQRRLLEPLQELACRPGVVQSRDREKLIASVASFVASVRSHVATEECALFRSLRTRIPRAAMTRVAERFAEFEATAIASGERGRLIELARILIDTHAPTCRPLHVATW